MIVRQACCASTLTLTLTGACEGSTSGIRESGRPTSFPRDELRSVQKRRKEKRKEKKKKENSFALRLATSAMNSTASSSYFVLFDTLLHRSLYTYIHLGRKRSQTAGSRESRNCERKGKKTSPLVSSPTDVPHSLPFESLRFSTAIEFAVKYYNTRGIAHNGRVAKLRPSRASRPIRTGTLSRQAARVRALRAAVRHGSKVIESRVKEGERDSQIERREERKDERTNTCRNKKERGQVKRKRE